MIFLLNYERVRYEVLELTKLRVAQMLHVSPGDLKVENEVCERTGKVSRVWSILALPEGIHPRQAGEAASRITKAMQDEYLYPRLEDAKKSAREERSG